MKEIDIAVYLEGVYIPATSVMIYAKAGQSKTAIIELPYIGQCKEIMLTTHVAIFYKRATRGSLSSMIPTDKALDSYRLAFHGEITGITTARQSLQMVYRLEAQDSSSYLNRMPNQFYWSLISENYRDNEEDFEFLGLPYAKDTYATKWFQEQGMTRLLSAYGPRISSVPRGSLKAGNYTIKEPSVLDGRGVNAVRGGIKPHYHQGEDYALESGIVKGTPLYVAADDGKVLAVTHETGYLAISYPWGLCEQIPSGFTIRIFHMNDIYVTTGAKLTGGTQIGTVGGKGGYEPHLHIELWAHGEGKHQKGIYGKGVYAYSDNGEPLSDVTNPKTNEKEQKATGGVYRFAPQILAATLGRVFMGGGTNPDTKMPANWETTAAAQFITLEDYVGGILHLLSTCDNPYLYYRNANNRFKIRDSHYIKDMPNRLFAQYFGADWYDSFISNQYQKMDKYRYTTMDSLYAGLSVVGYLGYSTSMPKYDPERNSLREYMVAPALYYQDPPAFNIIHVKHGDVAEVLRGTVPITALKYKAQGDDVTWQSIYSPPINDFTGYMHGDADYPIAAADSGYIGGEGSLYTPLKADYKSEIIYGMNRSIKDVSYYYGSYLERANNTMQIDEIIDGQENPTDEEKEVIEALQQKATQEKLGASSIYGRLCEMDRMLAKYEKDSISINFAEFKPQYVSGLPSIVYIDGVDECYWGMIESVSHVMDTNRGAVQTSIVVKMPIPMDSDPYARRGEPSGFKRQGVVPGSTIDMVISAGLRQYYRDNFYPDGDTGDVNPNLKGQVVTMYDVKSLKKEVGTLEFESETWRVDRSICTLRQYLEMYNHKNIDMLEGYNNIGDIVNFVTSSSGNESSPRYTIKNNAETLLVMEEISDIYIKERYDRAKGLSDAIRNKTVLYNKTTT